MPVLNLISRDNAALKKPVQIVADAGLIATRFLRQSTD
jgi:hypothetical protein